MLRKPIELPPAVAKGFVRDMRKFFRAKTGFDRGEIAAATGSMLKEHLRRGTKLRITDVKEPVLQMKDHA
jgi:hypothetical protein